MVLYRAPSGLGYYALSGLGYYALSGLGYYALSGLGYYALSGLFLGCMKQKKGGLPAYAKASVEYRHTPSPSINVVLIPWILNQIWI